MSHRLYLYNKAEIGSSEDDCLPLMEWGYELPLLLHDICPEYRMHLFRPRCLPAWETELCAAAR